jgi:hypothetical protein
MAKIRNKKYARNVLEGTCDRLSPAALPALYGHLYESFLQFNFDFSLTALYSISHVPTIDSMESSNNRLDEEPEKLSTSHKTSSNCGDKQTRQSYTLLRTIAAIAGYPIDIVTSCFVLYLTLAVRHRCVDIRQELTSYCLVTYVFVRFTPPLPLPLSTVRCRQPEKLAELYLLTEPHSSQRLQDSALDRHPIARGVCNTCVSTWKDEANTHPSSDRVLWCLPDMARPRSATHYVNHIEVPDISCSRSTSKRTDTSP